MRISRTALTCLLRLKACGTYPAGAAFGAGRTTTIAPEEAQFVVHPLPTPPLPIEALTIPSALHVVPDLLFHPVFHEEWVSPSLPLRDVVRLNTPCISFLCRPTSSRTCSSSGLRACATGRTRRATAAWFAKMQEWVAWQERYREMAERATAVAPDMQHQGIIKVASWVRQ